MQNNNTYLPARIFMTLLTIAVLGFSLTGCSSAPEPRPAPVTATGARSPLPQPPAGMEPVTPPAK